MESKLEDLLFQLKTRLPTDGPWATLENYGNLSAEQTEQTIIDEMVINSLDIFSITKNTSTAKTTSSLFVALGQFYFLKATYHHQKKEQGELEKSFIRSKIYFDKAISFDSSNAIAWRSRGVSEMWTSDWFPSDTPENDHKQLLNRAKHFIEKSLELDPNEPGALDADAMILYRDKQYAEAIMPCSKLIDLASNLKQHLKRKYLATAYLNRACFRILSLSSNTNAVEIDKIIGDLQEGLQTSKIYLAETVYLLRLNIFSKNKQFQEQVSRYSALSKALDELQKQ